MTEPSSLRATQAAYDTVAADYAELLSTELAAKPLDRALLAAFAELVQATGAGPVADLGCGPGRVTAHLHSLRLAAFGVDLSPAMVAVARRAHPGLQFDEGSMTALDLTDGILGGIVAWYSIIHTPPGHLPAAFAEFSRVLRPGGHLLLAFPGRRRAGAPRKCIRPRHIARRLPVATRPCRRTAEPGRARRARPAAPRARPDREDPAGLPPGTQAHGRTEPAQPMKHAALTG